MTLWKSISEINNRKFDATGDVKFALISLAADAKLPARPQPRAIPATAEDFRDELLNIQDSGGPVDDPVQKIIGRATASWLLDKTKTLKSETPIFRHKFPRSPLDGLISTLLPYDKLSVDSLRKELLSQKYPTVDIEQQVKELAETNSFVTNALTFVISIAFSSVLKQYLIKNPLLFLMDDDLVKNAGPEDSKKKFNYRSPRLSDLIDALNIIHGKYMIEYNQSVMADMLQSSPDEKLLFPMGAPASAKKTLDKSPSQIILLKAAYIKYYTELQRALFDYCASNPLEIGNKTISRHTGEVLTPNTYLNLNINDPRDIKGIVDLTPKEKKLSDLNIDMTLWNGEKYKIKSVGVSAEDIHSKFLANRESGELAAESIQDSNSAVEKARAYMQAQSSTSMIQAIAKLMNVPNASLATQIYDDMMSLSKRSASAAMQRSSDLYSKAMEDAKRRYGTYGQASKFVGTDFKTKDMTNLRMMNEEIFIAFEETKQQIMNKWASQFKDPAPLNMIFSNLFNTYALPIMPVTARYLYNSPSGQDLSSVDKRGATSIVDDGIRGVSSQISSIIQSSQFFDRYAANEVDYNEISGNKDKAIELKNKSMSLADNQPLLQVLHIDDATIKGMRNEISMAYAGTAPDAMARKRGVINKIISNSMQAFDNLSVNNKDLLGDVTRNNVMVYICEKVLPGIIEDYVTESLFQKTDIKTNEKYEQISNFVRTNFMSMRSSRQGGGLVSNTVYGKLDELYRAVDAARSAGRPAAEIEKLTQNPLGAIIRGAKLGHAAQSMSPALSMVHETLKRNANDSSVNDKNWFDPQNPRPRNMKELAQITGSFADPIPDVNSSSSPLVKRKRVNIQPGERISKEEIEKGEVQAGTVKRTLVSAINRLGKDLAGNPVAALRAAISDRKTEILAVSDKYSADIKPYSVDGDISFNETPFVADKYIPPEIEVSFDKASDQKKVEEIKDRADDPSKIDDIILELQDKGLKPDILDRVRKELQKLPESFLSEDKLKTTLEMVLTKIDPVARSVIKRDSPLEVKEKPVNIEGTEFIKSLSKTIFDSSDKLSSRLVPSSSDSKQQLNEKVKELMKYLNPLVSSIEKIKREMPNLRANPIAAGEARAFLDKANKYKTEILRAVNLSQQISESLTRQEESEEDSFLKTSLQSSRQALQQFISRMSTLEFYKDKPEVVKQVSAALNSLINSEDLGESIHPQKLQLLLLDLNRRLSANDLFDNLLLELDSYRAKQTIDANQKSTSEDSSEIQEMFEDIRFDPVEMSGPQTRKGDS